jgi:hypothetical protein
MHIFWKRGSSFCCIASWTGPWSELWAGACEHHDTSLVESTISNPISINCNNNEYVNIIINQIINTTFSGFSVGPAVVLNNSIWDFTNSGVLSGNQIQNTTSQGYVTTDISAASIIYQPFSKDIKIVDIYNSLKLIYWDSGSGAYLGTEIDN